MDRLIIELTSINKLEEVLLKTERIQPDIQRGDKIPSWDGELIVYKNRKLKKSNIMGNVRIQVKGSMQKDLSLDEIKFQVERSDLENYMKDGGCIFYVIYIKDIDNFKIYYNALLPFDLKLILNEMSIGQENKTLPFKEYPISDIELQMKVYRGFIHNRKKQMGTVDASFRIEEIDGKKAKQIDGFNFTLFQTGSDSSDIFNSAFKLPTYLYANLMDGKISIPIEKCTIEEIITSKLPEKLCLNGECFFNSIQIRKKDNDEQLLFGKGFCCSQKNKSFSFNINGTLNERIKDLNFLIKLCKSDEKILTVGDFYRGEFDKNCSLEDLETYEKHLRYLLQIDSALKCIGITEDLEYDNLTEIDEYYIKILLNCIILDKMVISERKLPLIFNATIKNIVFPIVTEYIGNNKYKLEVLFKKPNVLVPINSDEEVSAYLLMKRLDFLKISNLNYDIIRNEITKMNYSKTTDHLVTQFILEALIAYDQNQRKELYNCILEISKWQVKNINSDINYLNMFQIIKRQQNFDYEELLQLNQIKGGSDNIEVKLGASILLESKSEVETYWNLLDEEARIRFKTFPIYHFIELE